MEQIISSIDFSTATNQEYSNLQSALLKLKTNGACSSDEIRKCIRIMQTKVCTKNFARDDQPGYRCASLCMKSIYQAIDALGDSAGVKFQEQLLEFYLGCLTVRPTVGHLLLLDDMQFKRIEIFNCLNADKSKLGKLGETLKKASFLPASSDDLDKYADTLSIFLSKMMQSATKDTESLAKNADVWAEIYASVNEKLLSYEDAAISEAMRKITDGIHNRFEHIAMSSLYAFVSSISIPINHMARLEHIMDSVSNPSESLVRQMSIWLRAVCQPFISREEFSKAYFLLALEFMFRICIKPAVVWHSVAESVASFLNQVKDTVYKDKLDAVLTLICSELPTLILTASSMDNNSPLNEIAYKVIYNFLRKGLSNSNYAIPLIDVTCAIVSTCNAKLAELAPQIIKNSPKALAWKVNGKEAVRLTDALRTAALQYDHFKEGSGGVYNRAYHVVRDTVEPLVDQLDKSASIKSSNRAFILLNIEAMENPTNLALQQIANKSAAHCLWMDEPELFSKFLDVVHRLISTNVMASNDAATNCLKAAASGGMSRGLEQISDINEGPRCAQQLLTMLTMLQDKPVQDAEGHKTPYPIFMTYIMTFVTKNCHHEQVAALFARVTLALIQDYSDSSVRSYAMSALQCMTKHPTVVAKITSQLLDLFYTSNNMQHTYQYISLVMAGYPANTPAIVSYFDVIATKLSDETTDKDVRVYTLQLLQNMADGDPRVFDEKLAKAVGKLVTHELFGGTSMYLLGRLVDKRPELLNCQLDVLDSVLQAKVAVSQTPAIVTYWSQASLVHEETAKAVVAVFARHIGSVTTPIQLDILHNVHIIAGKYLGAVSPFKDIVTKLQTDPQLTDACLTLLDLIDGRSEETYELPAALMATNVEVIEPKVNLAEDKTVTLTAPDRTPVVTVPEKTPVVTVPDKTPAVTVTETTPSPSVTITKKTPVVTVTDKTPVVTSVVTDNTPAVTVIERANSQDNSSANAKPFTKKIHTRDPGQKRSESSAADPASQAHGRSRSPSKIPIPVNNPRASPTRASIAATEGITVPATTGPAEQQKRVSWGDVSVSADSKSSKTPTDNKSNGSRPLPELKPRQKVGEAWSESNAARKLPDKKKVEKTESAKKSEEPKMVKVDGIGVGVEAGKQAEGAADVSSEPHQTSAACNVS